MASEPSTFQQVGVALRIAGQETRRRPGLFTFVIVLLSVPFFLMTFLNAQDGMVTSFERIGLGVVIVVQIQIWVIVALAVRRADSQTAMAVFVDKAMAEEMYEFYLDPANQEPQGPPVQRRDAMLEAVIEFSDEDPRSGGAAGDAGVLGDKPASSTAPSESSTADGP